MLTTPNVFVTPHHELFVIKLVIGAAMVLAVLAAIMELTPTELLKEFSADAMSSPSSPLNDDSTSTKTSPKLNGYIKSIATFEDAGQGPYLNNIRP